VDGVDKVDRGCASDESDVRNVMSHSATVPHQLGVPARLVCPIVAVGVCWDGSVAGWTLTPCWPGCMSWSPRT
jgi:hypothetical protein